ncbi:response regulator [Sulfurimonas sp. MAG313]|nr:response regulator [Sulfurimonas sp. MAG313]MDF1881532.1 response regulator [Sulfurimonas sp. MAG313]
MYTIKDLHKYSKNLNILYVEDDKDLREETTTLFKMLFKEIDTAEDGQIGLDKYNNNFYDLIISDVNMPNMNGIEMCKKIKEINPEQKISIVSAHDESSILMDLIKAGANGFILKPMHMDDLIVALYPVCRDAYTQIINIELVNELNEKNEQLELQNKQLRTSGNVIETKHQQLGELIQEKKKIENSHEVDIVVTQSHPDSVDKDVLNKYFEEDTDEGIENILFLPDHCADLSEIFTEIPQIISAYAEDPTANEVHKISGLISKAASVLIYYSPYLDLLSTSFTELSVTLENNLDIFIEIMTIDTQSVLMLFDAVSADMERYVDRFSVESLAMKNIHHIHEPTALSIQQIITLIVPPPMEEGTDDIFDF